MKRSTATPTLSIVIPAYNVERYIAQAIRSALDQSLSALEVIVVDDGSTDGTRSIIQSVDDPRLRLVEQNNRGLSGARNSGIRSARAPLIGFLDGDDLWLPGKAQRHVDLMTSDPGLGLTYSHSMYIDEQDQPTGDLLLSDAARPTLERMIKRNHVGNGSTPVVRRDCFEIAGMFDEALASCEDWEMWVRLLARTDSRAELIDEVLTAYRINMASLSMDFDKFIANADKAAAKIAVDLPTASRAAIREGHAVSYRVAATKAVHNGARLRAAGLFARALRLCPWLPLVDARTVATAVMLLLPMQVNHWLRRNRSRISAAKLKVAKRTSDANRSVPDARQSVATPNARR